MRTRLSLVSTLVPMLFAASFVGAQSTENGPTTSDLFAAVLHPSWSVFLTGGGGSHGRFLLQQLPTSGGRQRAVRARDTFTAGGGIGMDFLPRTGVRVGYTFSTSDFVFRTDDGNETNDLDLEDGGMVHNHVASAEIIRYMFPARGPATPYGSAGLVASWWMLDGPAIAVPGNGSSTLFRWGGMASFGVQLQFSDRSAGRIEVASSSIRNPFTGGESYVVPGGVNIDEPSRVTQTDLRFGAVFYFSKPTDARIPVTARR